MEYSDSHPHDILQSGYKCLLSIIVPVYNVEEYIRSSVESIFRQNIEESAFEVIIVNDGTPDRSMEMIRDIISQHSNISIINQENLSLSVARNNGIAQAKGEYILMPDSDDLLVDDSLPLILEVAIESKADIVVADFLEMTTEDIETHNFVRQMKWYVEEKSGERLLLEDLDPRQCYVWRSLFRRDFILNNHIEFVPKIRYQDVPFTHECYLKAKKCMRVSRYMNIYRRGHESATLFFDKMKAYDFCIAIAETWKLTKLEIIPKLKNKIRNDVFVSFSTLICLISYSIKEDAERMDILGFLKQKAPDLFFKNGIKQIIYSILYAFAPHFFMNIHYFGRALKRCVKKLV